MISRKVRLKFSQNQAKTKQVEVVCQLIETLNSSRIKIETEKFSGSGASSQS